jgi:hypothetical protein
MGDCSVVSANSSVRRALQQSLGQTEPHEKQGMPDHHFSQGRGAWCESSEFDVRLVSLLPPIGWRLKS